MMWIRLILVLVLTSSGWAFHSPPADAGCVVRSTATYAEGTSLRDDECDTSGAKKVTTGGAGGASAGVATAAAPTHDEAEVVGSSYDLVGNQRVTLGTLISGEIQNADGGQLMTTGGTVRQTTVASAVTTNTTSAAVAVPIGKKTMYGQVVCSSGACVQTQDLYGDVDNDAANGILLCRFTLTATTRDQTSCIVDAPWSYYYVITTATSGTAAAGAVTAMY